MYQVKEVLAPLPAQTVEVVERPDRSQDLALTVTKIQALFPDQGELSIREDALILMSYRLKTNLLSAQHELFAICLCLGLQI